MRVLLTTLGSRGDVQPMVALGEALVEAGHGVLLAGPAEQRGLADAHSVPFRSLGGALRQLVQGELAPRNWAGGLVAQWHTFNVTLRTVLADTATDTLNAAHGCDVIVGSGLQLLGATVAEKLGLPYAYAAMAPVSLESAYYPPVPIAQLRVGRLANRAAWRITRFMANSGLGPPLNAVRAEMGLARVKDVLPHVIMNHPVLLAFSRHVCPPAPDWDPRHVQTGYWFPSTPGYTPPANLARFLGASEAPVYVGFGSMGKRDPLRTARMVLEAARSADVRVVLAGQWGGLGGEGGREDARAFVLKEEAPHGWLFPQMAGVVHHGGAGTTAAGIRAGRATGVVPHLGDQYFWGRRLEELGAGPRPVPLRDLSAAKLAPLLRATGHDEGMREAAARLGEGLRKEEGVAGAVRFIEALAG